MIFHYNKCSPLKKDAFAGELFDLLNLWREEAAAGESVISSRVFNTSQIFSREVSEKDLFKLPDITQ